MQRNNLIDIAKGIGILIVVFGHNWIVLHEKGELFRVIFSFHMPLFFIISGVFLKPLNPFRQTFLTKFSALIKPYLNVLFFVCFVDLVRNRIRFGVYNPSDLLAFLKVLYGTGSTIPWVPLWFLPHLFVAIIVSAFILKSIRGLSTKYIYLLCIAFLSSGWAATSSIHANGFGIGSHTLDASVGLPWSIDLLPITCSFVIFGYLMRDKINNITPRVWVLFFSSFAFVALHFFFDETIDLNLRIYGGLFVSTAQAIIGVYICLNFAWLLNQSKHLGGLFSYIGSQSLFILIFHGFFQGFAFGFSSKYFANPYFCGIIGFAVGTITPLVINETTKRVRILSFILLPRYSRIGAGLQNQ